MGKYVYFEKVLKLKDLRILKWQGLYFLKCFLHPLPPYLIGEEMLTTRRSIRNFESKPVSDELLCRIFEDCRYAPTSKNSQSYYFIVIRDRNKLELLASLELLD